MLIIFTMHLCVVEWGYAISLFCTKILLVIHTAYLHSLVILVDVNGHIPIKKHDMNFNFILLVHMWHNINIQIKQLYNFINL